MGTSKRMRRNEKTLTARVDPAQHKRLKAMISQFSEASMNQFITDAVVEKLERGGVDTTEAGVLRGLTADDRTLVEWLADTLRGQAGNTLLREVFVYQKLVLLALKK